MKKFRAGTLTLFLLIAGLALLSAVCQRTVLRDGVKVPVEEAQKNDLDNARAALDAGRYDDAIALYSRFSEDFPNSPFTVQALVKTGEAYYKKGDLDRAEHFFQDALKRFPKDPEAVDAAWGLALIHYSQKDCAALSAVVMDRRDLAEGRRWDQMTMLLAECEKEAGDIDRAFELYVDECRQGRDDQIKDGAKEKLNLMVKDVGDSSLEEAAADYQDGFPGDLALLTLVQRNLDHDKLDKASSFADQFQTRFPDSKYYPDFEKIRSLLERRTKVKANRLGVMLPLSGDLAALGAQALKGMMLAAKVFDQAGAIFSAELIIRDDSSGDTPEQIVDSLVNDSHVIAIVGPLRAGVAERAAKKAQELGVPIITLSPYEGLPLLGDMVYQNCLTKSEQAEALADYAVRAQGITSFAALYADDQYSREFFQLFAKAVAERGGAVTAVESYDRDSTDFKDQIRALKQKKKTRDFKALFIPEGSDKIVMIAPQLRFYNLTGVRLLGTNGWHSPELLAHTQPADVEGAVFCDGIAPEANKPTFNSFARHYKDEFNETPGIIEAQAYESVDLLLSVINRYMVKDRQQLKTALDHTEDYPGVLGQISVDPHGRWQKPVYLFMITDSEFTVISE
jgi:ABC-type branched-subunit amino acid transport system substrate-binding protein